MLSVSFANNDAGNEHPDGQIIENEEKIISGILEKFGLNWAAIESTGGQSAADLMSATLAYIAVVKSGSKSILQIERTAICSALLTWQSMSSRHLKEKALYSNNADRINRILSIVQSILSLPNDPLPIYKYGAQMPGLYLSQLLLRESRESVSAANQISEPIAKTLDLLFLKKGSTGEFLTVREEATNVTAGSISIPIGPDSVRAETVKNLVKCICLQLSDASAAIVTDCLLKVLARCLDTAPSLCADIASTVSSLLEHKNQHQQHGRLKAHMSTLVAAIKKGHNQILPLLKNNPTLFSSEIRAIEIHIESLLASVGALDLNKLLMDISEKDARTLIKSIPTLIIELEQNNEGQKKLVLDVLQAISYCDPAAVAAHLVPIEAACYPPTAIVAPSADYVSGGSAQPFPLSICRLPLLKLVATIGAKSHSEEIVTECLAVVARITRAFAGSLANEAVNITKEEQGACLEALNVIKDRARYCNIFHRDTVLAMDKIADSNLSTHQNLCKWNAGKTALKGNLNLFLLTAGQTSLTHHAPEEKQRNGKWWLPLTSSSKSRVKVGDVPVQSERPATAPSVGTPSFGNSVYGSKSGRAVGPSPFFNHGEAAVPSAGTPAVAKNLFGDKAPSQQSDSPGQYVSFSDFINRQRDLTELSSPREGSGVGPTPLAKSEGLSEASPVGEMKDGERT